jgi:hypothetical protein
MKATGRVPSPSVIAIPPKTEQDQAASLDEQQTRHDPKQEVRHLYCTVHVHRLLSDWHAK